MKKPSQNSETSDTHFLGLFLVQPSIRTTLTWAICFLLIANAMRSAYEIRTKALTEYGMVIHEFDPWFNYRATEYLEQNGWHAFFHWYDYMVWYPLGRPVGTTIYPGLQITSVLIYRVFQASGIEPYSTMSLNDVCCTVPCWFGAITTVFLGLLTYECTGSIWAMAISTQIMAILPAHIMRSVGGGYDNESIAMSAICATFYFWLRSIRPGDKTYSWLWGGILTGLSYGYMVAAWGGYIFVLNMVAVHAVVVMLLDWAHGTFDSNVIKAYTIFFVIGTSIAIRVPPVGMTPFKSLEQLSAVAVLVGMAILYVSEFERKRRGVDILSAQGVKLRIKYVFFFIGGCIALFIVLLPTGFFGPISARVRGLFVQHMKTGNPLVDSVAEHQPGSPESFWQFLHIVYVLAPLGFGILFMHPIRQSSFAVLSYIIVQYFALKMSRLIILSSVPNAVLAGGAIGLGLGCVLRDAMLPSFEDAANSPTTTAPATSSKGAKKVDRRSTGGLESLNFAARWRSMEFRKVRFCVFLFCLIVGVPRWFAFQNHAERMAEQFSHTSLIFKHQDPQTGKVSMIDDYREAYWWLRDQTPEDSRILAWWDYGYQITGIGNRTTLADGNTWNHEHIATIGRCLTSPVATAHRMIRHLADYVLVWSGGGGDDLAKSPWMARIGNSVYRDICPDDPLCEKFGFKADHSGSAPSRGDDLSQRDPTPMMARSLLYNIHMAGRRPGVGPDPKLFEEAYTSKHGLIRIFKVMNISQESKNWAADPKNRVCDAPGSWYCTGQYPPAEEVQEVLRKRISFKQIEDFNAQQHEKDDFNEQYLKRSIGEA